MNLEKIIEISHKIADPYIKSAEAWKFTAQLLALLLFLSVCGNIYLSVRGVEISFDADENIESDISQSVE